MRHSNERIVHRDNTDNYPDNRQVPHIHVRAGANSFQMQYVEVGGFAQILAMTHPQQEA
jgi:hypothetical protein